MIPKRDNKKPKKPASRAQAPRKQAVTLKPIHFTSARCFAIASRWWKIILITLPLDGFLIETPLLFRPSSDKAVTIALILAALAAAGTFREQLLLITASLRSKGKVVRQKYSSLLIYGALALIAIELVIRFVPHISLANAFFFILAFGVVLYKILSALKEMARLGKELTANPLLSAQAANKFHLALVLAPAVAARAISLVIALHAQAFESPWGTYAIATTTSLLLLLGLQPRKEDFVVLCKACLQSTSRALKELGYCPSCKPEAFTEPEIEKTT